MDGGNALALTEDAAPNNSWWIVLVVIFGVIVLALVLLLAFSGRIVSGKCGPTAKKYLTHRNPNIPILFANEGEVPKMGIQLPTEVQIDAASVSRV